MPKPTSHVYVAVDPSNVVEFKAANAFTTTGGGPQSVTKECNGKQCAALIVLVPFKHPRVANTYRKRTHLSV